MKKKLYVRNERTEENTAGQIPKRAAEKTIASKKTMETLGSGTTEVRPTPTIVAKITPADDQRYGRHAFQAAFARFDLVDKG